MDLLVVWSPATLIVSVIAGLGVGYWIVGRVAADPAWASPSASAGGLALLVAVLAIGVGLVFFVGQATATAVEGGPWERVASRFGLWVVYAIFLGLGTGRRVADHMEARRAAARIRAHRELDR
jgi:hypothetical protein